MLKSLIAATALALPLAAMAQPTSLAARTQAEIDHLFTYIAQSGCKFNRNGSWHNMDEARDHVATKYDWLRGRGMIDSAETFIDRAASRSSFSGSDYLVQCPGAQAVPSGGWLKAELARFRGERKE
jgi:hypothetical protein